jgi:hypothetical protein
VLIRLCGGCSLAVVLLCTSAAAAQRAVRHDSRHDFDFEFGTWRTHVKLLAHPLTGSKTWVEYDGTTMVHRIWNGAANLVELDVRSKSGGRLQLASFRLYDPATGKWSLYVTNIRTGTFGVPTVGGFSDGRGMFYDKESWNGRPILVRFVITPRDSRTVHFVQAFSADGGKTWETNWIADDTRIAATDVGSQRPRQT